MKLATFYTSKIFDNFLSLIAAVVLLLSTVHFWPFSSCKLWQYLVPFNSLPLLVGIIMIFLSVFRPDICKCCVPASLLFFVVVCGLSLVVTPDIKRSLFYTVKVFGALIGYYVLLLYILKKTGNINPVVSAIVVGCFVAVIYCLYSRIESGDKVFGFHVNAYKYSTFMSVFGCFSVNTLILQRKVVFQVLGYALLVLLFLSAATIGLVMSIFSAFIAMMAISFFAKRNDCKNVFFKYILCIILCAGCFFVKAEVPFTIIDAELADGQLAPLKQRYIEWQAEINILKDRLIAGCGAGAINTYRSEYYGQLPKLNTLEEFDQNGYLAITAELGLLGLLALVWMFSYYFRKVFSGISCSNNSNQVLTLSCFCSLVAACVANVFSSVFYNGVLVSLVTIFVLVDYIADFNKGEQI